MIVLRQNNFHFIYIFCTTNKTMFIIFTSTTASMVFGNHIFTVRIFSKFIQFNE